MTLSAATRRRLALATVTSLVLGAAGALAVATPAMAATYTVDSLTDDGVGNTLREAIVLANGNAGVDAINFDPLLTGGTLVINSVLLITEELTISGPGSTNLSIERSGSNVGSDFFVFQPAADGDDFSLSGITITGDDIKTGSGVVANDNSTGTPGNVTITDVVFERLTNSVIGGAAILIDGSTGDGISGILSILGSGFYDILSGGAGGAISAVDVGTFISIATSEFIGNESGGDGGGAVYVESPSAGFSITDTEFDDNFANDTGSGGAVLIAGAAAVNVTRSNFESNISYDTGGAISDDDTTSITVTDSLFFDNTVTNSRGGGLYVGGSSGIVTITGTTFSLNRAEIGGGGFASLGDVYVEIEDSFFFDNSTPERGGAIYQGANDGTTSIARTTFSGNTANLYGGGVYVDGIDAGGEFTVHSSTFAGNDGDGGGNALALASIDGVATVINSTIDEAAAGVAVLTSVFDGELRLRYSTIFGGVFIEANENVVEIVSSILGDDANALAVDPGEDAVSVSYSLLSSADSAEITDGGNNQFSVADFKLGPLQDNGGPTFTRLPLAGSPAIDRGFPGGTPPTFDQRYTGFPRVLGGRVDIGAVESSVLAATGQTINLWIPIAGGVLLLGGVAAITVSALRRRRLG
ncbi:MAG: choice-of-anchor Q domain-containing protein [Rhodoglobus sp.]